MYELFEDSYNVICSLNAHYSHLSSQLQLVLTDYVSGWVNMANESLNLLFKSTYLIYNRHIDPIELKFLLHAKSINIDFIITIKPFCISQQLVHNKPPQYSSHRKKSINS